MFYKTIFSAFFLTSIFSSAAIAAGYGETAVTYKFINKSNNIIEANLARSDDDGIKTTPTPTMIQPNSTVTFSDFYDLDVSSLPNGDYKGNERGFTLISGEKACYFFTSIKLTKSGKTIDREQSNHSKSAGKQPAGCEIDETKRQDIPPYSYSLELRMY